MPTRTIHEHVQAVREGRDYKSPLLAINDTIEGLVQCGLIVRSHEGNLTPEVRALDAIGEQVKRELTNRKMMILALTDRVNTLQAMVDMAKEQGFKCDVQDTKPDDTVVVTMTGKGVALATPAPAHA